MFALKNDGKITLKSHVQVLSLNIMMKYRSNPGPKIYIFLKIPRKRSDLGFIHFLSNLTRHTWYMHSVLMKQNVTSELILIKCDILHLILSCV